MIKNKDFPYPLRWKGAEPSERVAFAYLGGFAVGTYVYIDGFNLYYAIKYTQYKWLDLSALCSRLLPKSNVQKIYYFTAKVQALPHDPTAPIRQET